MSPWRCSFGPFSSSRAPGPDRFPKAIAAGADAVVFDLEDGVEASRKADARRIDRGMVDTSEPTRTARFVRVNGAAISRGWMMTCPGCGDWRATSSRRAAEGRVGAGRRACRRVAPSRRVIPAARNLARHCRAPQPSRVRSADIPALIFGAEDLTAELGIPRTLAGDEILLARSQVVLAAATIGADAVDAVFVDLPRSTIGFARMLPAPARSASAARWRSIPIRSRSSMRCSARRPRRSRPRNA